MAAKKKPRAKAPNTQEAAALRRKVFAQAFIANGGNATAAAKTAGFSAKTAGPQGSRLLRHVEVQALVNSSAEKIARKYELTADMVVRSIVQEITFDPARLYDDKGQLKAIREMDEDTRAALVGLEITEEEITSSSLSKSQKDKLGVLRTAKVKWAAKQGAREQAMKHLGMFKADNAQRSLVEGVPREILLAIAERLKGLPGGR